MRQHGFVNLTVIFIAVVVVGIVGYVALKKPLTNQPFSTPLPNQVVQQNSIKSEVDNCTLISDSTFHSVNKYEVGLGPPDVPSEGGFWSVVFQQGKFSWLHSDVVESGTYSCKDNSLQVEFFDRSSTASYDGDRKILIWEGVEYRQEE